MPPLPPGCEGWDGRFDRACRLDGDQFGGLGWTGAALVIGGITSSSSWPVRFIDPDTGLLLSQFDPLHGMPTYDAEYPTRDVDGLEAYCPPGVPAP